MQFGKTVLIIDDDKDDLEMLQHALTDVDGEHKIVEAADGVYGLGVLNEMVDSKELPCLIVLDINMPRMDGRETLVKIKSDEKLSKIPIVIFSTSSSQMDKTFFDRYGTAYFVKPINFEDLKKTAARLISICKHNSENKV